MSTGSVRIPGFVPDIPGVEEMPTAVRQLALLLSFATRIEPELIRAARVGVRPDLHVGAESALWFGSWSHRNSAEYMVMRPSLLEPLRELLCAELQASSEGDAVRRTGEIVFRIHHGLSPVLALEERVTWAAVLADAGLGALTAGSDPQSDVDRLLERALRAAVEAPGRREGLRRWFTGAWQRFPERVRQTPAALSLYEVLDLAGRSVASSARTVRSRVGDVPLPVRHDGAYITVGVPGWPAESILVPDTQPRVLEVTGDLSGWETAEKIRVPRSGQVALAVSHVPVYLRTSRGDVYQVGAPYSQDAVGHLAHVEARSRNRGLLGGRVSDLRDTDAVRFGIAPLIVARRGAKPPDYRHPQHELRSELLPYSPHALDARLGAALRRAATTSQLLVVEGEPSSGRTRTAWEAMRRALSGWWVWCPRLLGRAEALIDAIVRDELGAQTVVWLDDLDLLLADPATGERVAEVLETLLTDPACRPVLLVATSAGEARSPTGLGERARALLARGITFTLSQPRTGRPSLGTELLVSAVVSEQPRHKVLPKEELPARGPDFVGRATELAQLFSALGAASPSAFVVVSGLPGIGKSALAREAAIGARTRGWFPGGVLWLGLAGQPFTPARLLARLGVDEPSQPADEAGRWVLCAALLCQLTDAGQLPVLLVLDDVPSWEFDDLPTLAPGVSVLVTSRGSGTSQEVQPLVLQSMDDAEARDMLAAELEWREAGERVDASPADRLRLAQACGGLPLAISVAAARLAADARRTVASLADAAARWPADASALTDDGRSVLSALEWSYARLTTAQQQAFRLLSLHPTSSFATAAAAEVLDRAPERVLRRLAQCHLLHFGTGERRWAMDELVKRYANELGERHADADGRQDAFERLTRHYVLHAEAADAWLRAETPPSSQLFASRKQALAWMISERASLVAAVDRCVETGRRRAAAAIALALAEFLTRGQHFEDLLHVMGAVLNSSAATGDDWYTRAAVLNNFAVAMGETGDFSEAMSSLKRAAELHGKLSEGQGAYVVMLRNLASTLLIGNRPRDAVEALEEAATYCQEPADAPVRSEILGQLGLALLEAEDPVQAITPLRETLMLMARIDAPVLERAMFHSWLGTALARSGERKEALAELAQATALCNDDESGNHPRQAAVKEALGRALMENGRFARSGRLLGEAAAIYLELENMRSAARALNDQGLALLETGDGYDALHALDEARRLYLMMGDDVPAAQCSNNVGKVLRRLGQHDAAIEILTPAAQQLLQAGDEAGAAETLLNLGLAHLAEGATGQAVESLSASAELHAAVGNLTSRAHALLALGRASLRAGDQDAVHYLQSAAEAFRYAPSPDGKIDALLLLSDVLDVAGRKDEARAALREAQESLESGSGPMVDEFRQIS
ncbi:AAA family ATPase [Streptomyces chartreusis]|uniref:AAA family ATPase n=1 Tax=Streptomyces chartreusis TaxID=1969 RepID=UPI00382D4FD4